MSITCQQRPKSRLMSTPTPSVDVPDPGSSSLDQRLSLYRHRIGKVIEDLREDEEGLTQQELGTKLGVGRGAVASWESGATSPSADKLLELCAIFDVSAEMVLGRTRSRTGLTPGDIVVDLDAAEAVEKAEDLSDLKHLYKGVKYSWDVPQRHQILTPAAFRDTDVKLEKIIEELRRSKEKEMG